MKAYALLLALALPMLVVPGVAREPAAAPAKRGLCKPGETVIFTCNLGKKLVSVCGGNAPGGATYARYRLGTPGKLDLEYPGSTGAGAGGMYHAETTYSGGGEAQVVFSNGGFQYVVYSSMVRTNFKANEPNNPEFEAGVTALSGDKAVSRKKCTPAGEGDVDVGAASKFMPEGEFIDRP